MDLTELLFLIEDLAQKRPIFHSEADFQHAFAWQIHARYPNSIIRLETRPLHGEAKYLDVFAVVDEVRVAVELKYLVRSLDLTIRGERFQLRDQGAHDVRRYDVVKDLSRIECFIEKDIADVGFVIAVSNDPAYWKEGTKAHPIDKDFRLYEGNLLSGKRSWSPNAGAGTTRGRSDSIELKLDHDVVWRDYSTSGDGPDRTFRYLAMEVRRSSHE